MHASTKQASKMTRFKELVVITLLGSIPTIFFGVLLRRWIYRTIFAQIGKDIYIQDGAEFFGAMFIEFGDRVHIFRDVRIDGCRLGNRIRIGNDVAIERGVNIGALENTSLEIGDRTYLAPGVFIVGPGNIHIGKDCMIAANTGLIANNHKFDDPIKPIREQGNTFEGIVIEDNCWLGYGVTVLDGVTIGQGSVIGAGAVVTKNVPPNSIAVGVPARVIRQRCAMPETLDFTAQLSV